MPGCRVNEAYFCGMPARSLELHRIVIFAMIVLFLVGPLSHGYAHHEEAVLEGGHGATMVVEAHCAICALCEQPFEASGGELVLVPVPCAIRWEERMGPGPSPRVVAVTFDRGPPGNAR